MTGPIALAYSHRGGARWPWLRSRPTQQPRQPPSRYRRRHRARLRVTGQEARAGAGHRAELGVAYRDVAHGQRARIGDDEAVGDRVAQVGDSVVVDVYRRAAFFRIDKLAGFAVLVIVQVT